MSYQLPRPYLNKSRSSDRALINKGSAWNAVNGLQHVNTKLVESLVQSKEKTKIIGGLNSSVGNEKTLKRPSSLAIIRSTNLSVPTSQQATARVNNKSPNKLYKHHKSASTSLAHFTNLKVQNSLSNLLSFQHKNTGDTSAARGIDEQSKKVSVVIDMNFRVKGGILNTSINKSRDIHPPKERSILSSAAPSRPGSRLDLRYSRKTKSSLAMAFNQDLDMSKKDTSPRGASVKINESPILMGDPNNPLKGLEDLGDIDSNRFGRKADDDIAKRSKTLGVSILKKSNFVNNPRPATAIDQNMSLATSPKNTSMVQHHKNDKYEELLSKKVTEKQRDRLEQFLKDDFVNDLIYTKYYKVMDDEQKIAALNNLKKQMVEHKNIRDQYKGNTPELSDKFFEQFNKTKNKNKTNLASPKVKEDYHYPGLRQHNQAFELFTPHGNSPTFKRKSPNFFAEVSVNVSQDPSAAQSPTNKSEKDNDYYINQGLINKLADEEAKKGKKKKKKLKTGKMIIDEEQQRLKYARIRMLLKQKLFKCAQLNITSEEIVTNPNLFPKKSYERQGSYAFIKAAKYGDYFTIAQYIDKDRFYILEYDAIKQTALHWAAKRSHLDIVNLLIKSGADVDAIDMGGRTPLYYALRESEPEIVRVLLYARADPWSSRGFDYRAACKEFKSLKYLLRARQLSIISTFVPANLRHETWDKDAKTFLAKIKDDNDDQMARLFFIRRSD